MNNKYNLYFNSFTKEYSLMLSSLNLTGTRDLLDFELIRDLLFFKSSNVKALGLKFFGALDARSVELQRFRFVEVYADFLA